MKVRAKRKPRILVTNDDGVGSPGLHALYRELSRLGPATIVAPDAERSAVGHAITTLSPLQVKELTAGPRRLGYSVSGMPADCVKLAVSSLLDEPPDLVVSGINLGPNTGINVIYSGTVSAATEARILGIPSIAVSLGTFTDPRWEPAARIARHIASLVLAFGLPRKVLLNVNVPNSSMRQIKGVKVTRMGSSGYNDQFTPHAGPDGQRYYMLTSKYVTTDTDDGTDAAALAAGWVVITPVTYDLTAYDVLEDIAQWPLKL